jgi:hypothetical protein
MSNEAPAIGEWHDPLIALAIVRHESRKAARDILRTPNLCAVRTSPLEDPM